MADSATARLLLRYRLAGGATLVLGIALSTVAFLAANATERSVQRRAFDDAALNVKAAISVGLHHSFDQVDSVGALFESSNQTDYARFKVFAKQLLAAGHGMQALEWIPRVPSAMRDRYEKTMQAALPGFQITERNAQGETVRAGEREEYFPVYFVEPEARNKAAIGFDLGSDANRLEALAKARDTGTVVATGRITLVQETATQYGFLLFRPVYRSGLPHDTSEQRRKNLLGFALGVFRAGDVIETATGHLRASGVNAVIYDDSAPAAERFLASWPTTPRESDSAAALAQGEPTLALVESFNVGERSWRMVLTPTEQFYAANAARPAWTTLVFGTLLTAILAAYIESARKHLHKELESKDARLAAEEKLSDILGSIDSILMSVSPATGELLYANRAAEIVLGRPSADFSANKKRWLEAIHPQDQDRVDRQLSLPSENRSWTDEFRILRPDGEMRWLGAKAKVVLDASDKPERVDIVASDITDQRQAEARRQRSEEKFRSLFNATGDAIIINGMDGRFREVNQAAVDRLGYSREELLRMTPADIVTPQVAAQVPQRIAEIARAGHLIAETENISKDGRVIPGEIHTKLIDYEGSPAVLTVIRDTTERKQAQVRIQQAELRYRTLFQRAPLGIVIIDIETGAAVEFNDIAHTQLGYSREEFARLRISDYEILERPEEISAHIDKVLRQGSDMFATRHRTKSGELRDVRVMVQVLELAGSRHLYSIYHDVTEQRKGELALQRANRALRTLSAANEELVHATSEQDLLQSVCRVIVEKSGNRMAGVCYARDDAGKSIIAMAWAGAEHCCAAGEIQTWADTEYGQRPISRAVRSGKPEIDRDIPSDPALARWKEAAVKGGYASVLALPLSDGTRIVGGLCVYSPETDAFDAEEIHLLEELANDLAYGIITLRTKEERDRIAYQHRHHEEILRKSLEESIQAIAGTVEMRDPYTAGHQRRSGDLAVAIAREMGLPEERIQGLRLAASIHDLGKVKVPAEILSKPAKLTQIELMLMKTHAQAGYEILKDIAFPWPIATIVWQHHERLDGSGYPQGLRDGQILPESRIMAVADVVEAMASHRPYRPSLGIEAALAEIERGRGSAYDAAAVDACLRLFREGCFVIAD